MSWIKMMWPYWHLTPFLSHRLSSPTEKNQHLSLSQALVPVKLEEPAEVPGRFVLSSQTLHWDSTGAPARSVPRFVAAMALPTAARLPRVAVTGLQQGDVSKKLSPKKKPHF